MPRRTTARGRRRCGPSSLSRRPASTPRSTSRASPPSSSPTCTSTTPAASTLLPASLPVYVQRREWEGGRDPDAIARNFLHPRDYEGVADQVVLVDGDHDLLGDGSVELLFTPGHTPGHQSVRVGERLVIGGDVTHFASGLDDLRLPIFGDDLAAQAASAERLRAIRDGGVEVRPGHDPEVLVPGPVPTS